MLNKKILVVDDEPRIVDVVKAYLERDGYRVLTAADGQTALNLARRERPALVILDLLLPEIDGLEVCRTLRQESSVPVIMLTARTEETDKLIGLELGADDYVTKPFSPRELVARVRAVLRRAIAAEAAAGAGPLVRDDLSIDPTRHTVTRAGQPIALTPTEFALLLALAQSPGRVFTRLQLMDRALGETYEGYERTLDAHIKNLRRKLEPDPAHPRYVQTVFGVGYKFAE